MNVAWDLSSGGCRTAKQCFFSCKVAGVDDEGQLLCEAGAGLVPRSPHCIMAVSICFACTCTLHLHCALDSFIAKRVVIIAVRKTKL